MKNIRLRNIFISIFVIIWMAVFQYESSRAFFLDPYIRKANPNFTRLPKLKFLFPPAGWIMFYNIGDSSGAVEVYGVKDKTRQLIDLHDIFETRTFGFDNIHRGIAINVIYKEYQQPFCNFMRRKFPYFDNFVITIVNYPSVTRNRQEKKTSVYYQCQ